MLAEYPLMFALLLPNDELKKLQEEEDFTKRLVLMEELKSYPFGDIWNYHCHINNVPIQDEWYGIVKKYEKEELLKRI
ncbi:L-rhamnose isomerase [Acidilutibacter cellobiosedens]|jgi:L-rhamnose isomerase|uniref:L-rhamnose isomerase n=1 Tax=Acidilutibacter cellobiosedens TaxID=2507161 RepID=UPI001F0CA194|nr:L-rhamnose isomerase [Acidilutibacter cellobiosedens]